MYILYRLFNIALILKINSFIKILLNSNYFKTIIIFKCFQTNLLFYSW